MQQSQYNVTPSSNEGNRSAIEGLVGDGFEDNEDKSYGFWGQCLE